MIPFTTELSTDFESARIELIDRYQQLANAVNGRSESWTPTLGGSSTDGTVTYTTQVGWLSRIGSLIDIWFSIVWSAHSGTGNLELILPFEVLDNGSNIWVGEVSDASITYTGKTHLNVIGKANDDRAEFVASVTGGARSTVAVQAAGTLEGHLRYITKQRR